MLTNRNRTEGQNSTAHRQITQATKYTATDACEVTGKQLFPCQRCAVSVEAEDGEGDEGEEKRRREASTRRLTRQEDTPTTVPTATGTTIPVTTVTTITTTTKITTTSGTGNKHGEYEIEKRRRSYHQTFPHTPQKRKNR